MYKTLQKSAFPFMNCWNELRFSPKFTSNFSKKKAKGSQTASPATSSPSTPDPVNMNDVLDNDHALERPTGRKSTKELFRKAKEKAQEDGDQDVKNIFAELKEAHVVSRNERSERLDELMRMAKERQEMERRKEERQKKRKSGKKCYMSKKFFQLIQAIWIRCKLNITILSKLLLWRKCVKQDFIFR